jgi:hypothetical protein
MSYRKEVWFEHTPYTLDLPFIQQFEEDTLMAEQGRRPTPPDKHVETTELTDVHGQQRGKATSIQDKEQPTPQHGFVPHPDEQPALTPSTPGTGAISETKPDEPRAHDLHQPNPVDDDQQELTIIEPDDQKPEANKREVAQMQAMYDSLQKVSAEAMHLPSSDRLAAILVKIHEAMQMVEALRQHMIYDAATHNS